MEYNLKRNISNILCCHYWIYIDQKREALFFHEFGHCILVRFYSNELLLNGDPKSIMVEHNVGLYTTYFNRDSSCQDHSYRRTYYLDELFNEQTPVPQWGQ